MENIFGLSQEYNKILNEIHESEYFELVKILQSKFSKLWINSYKSMGNRVSDICFIKISNFTYIYDDPKIDYEDLSSENSEVEPRIVAVCGISKIQSLKRDDNRLKGWLGKTEETFGKTWDKGHFIAHSIGGTIERSELNVYPQNRSLNRGWSEEGKKYRNMERYCMENIGSFFFNRPIYVDESFIPKYLEFGILKTDKSAWIEIFENF